MFIFAHKTDTPISTYRDSYRVPCRTDNSYKEPNLSMGDMSHLVSKVNLDVCPESRGCGENSKEPFEEELLF